MNRRILIATDSWHPLVNGVVRTLDTTTRTLRERGHVVKVIEPSPFAQLRAPFYPEIPLSLPWPNVINDQLKQFKPDHVHISTEGPIGLMVRHYCRQRGWKFSTSYHTRFPEYLQQLANVPTSWSYRVLRWFHNRSSSLMVATPSLEAELKQRGFTAPMNRWSRGVDLTQFQPRTEPQRGEYEPPVMLYVGRVSVEKGIEDFLKLNRPGTKLIVGDGPIRPDLERRYPDAKFLGYRNGQALAECYAAADLFVFPSKTDTFGIVLIEALATGLPVAAYPVTGPIDIITDPKFGSLNNDLGIAIEQALAQADRPSCIAEGQRYTWDASVDQFLGNLVAVKPSSKRTDMSDGE